MILFICANTAFFNNLHSLGLGKPCFSLAYSNKGIYSTRKCHLVLLSNDEGLRYVRDEYARPICAENCVEGYKDEKKFTQPVLNAI
jgi:hypothetical protein